MRTRTVAGWRLSVVNSSPRSSTALTGRPALRARAAVTASRRVNVLAPNEPPIGGATTRMRSGSIPKAPARSSRRLKGVWVPVCSSSRPSGVQAASVACGSIAACWAPAVWKVSSTVTAACAKPCSASPWTSRKRWQTFVPASGRTPIETASSAEPAASGCSSGAPSATAASASNTAGQLLVLHGQREGRRAGRGGRGRGHGGHDVAHEARGIGQHLLVLELAAVAAEPGGVGRQQRHRVRRQRARVDRAHPPVRHRRAHEGRVPHALHGGVLGVVHELHASASTARRTSTAITRRR